MAEIFPTQLPAGASRSGVIPWKALIFSGAILGATFIVYLGLAFGYKPFIEASIANGEARIAELDQTAPKSETEAKFVQFYSQLTNISSLLASHTAVSQLFNTLETSTMADFGFAGMSIDVPGRIMSASGFAGSYQTLAGQISLYEGISGIGKVALSSARLADEFVRFELRADFTPEFFRFNPPVSQPVEQPGTTTEQPGTPIEQPNQPIPNEPINNG